MGAEGLLPGAIRSIQMHFRGAEFAIVTVRWHFYLGLPQSDPFHRSFLLIDGQARKDPYEILAAGLAATLSDAKRAGIRRILIIAPLPEFPWYSPACVVKAIRVGSDTCSILGQKSMRGENAQ